MSLFPDRVSTGGSIKAVQICMCFVFTNQSHQIQDLFLYLKILECDLYLFLTNLERQRELSRMNKGSGVKYLTLLLCVCVFSSRHAGKEQKVT